MQQPDPICNGRPVDILIAEDNPVNQKVLAAMLKRLGYSYDVVENGSLACDAVRTKEYSLVLMDVRMPEMDGLEATRRIRAWEAQDAAHVPIVAVTANSTIADRRAGCDAGMDDYLAKPIDQRLLRELLEDWLGGDPLPQPFTYSRRQVEAGSR
jgi:CheY-like chemotaxis protein